MNSLKQFISTAITFFVGNVLTKLIAFLMIPLYTSYFSPEDFGLYDLIITILTFLSPLLFFQIWDGMFRFSFDKDSIKEKYNVISNAIIVMLIGSFLFTIIFVIYILNFSLDNKILIYIYGLFISIQYFYSFSTRIFLKNKLLMISGLCSALANAGMSLYLILVVDYGIESLFLSYIFGVILQIVIIESSINVLKNFKLVSLDKKLQFKMIKFSFPLFISSGLYWMLTGYTKMFIVWNLGSGANGLYAIAIKFTTLSILVITVFQYAWNEMSYVVSGKEDKFKKLEVGLNYLFNIVILSTAIFLIFVKLIFPYFVGETYQTALYIFPLALIGLAANSFSNFVGTIFMMEKNTKWIFWTTLVASIINIVLMKFFTFTWGLKGALAILMLAFLTLMVLRMSLVYFLYGFKIRLTNVKNIIFLILSTFIFYVVENKLINIISLLIFIIYLIFITRLIWLPLLNNFMLKNKL